MKSMKHLTIPKVNLSIKPNNATVNIDRMAAELLLVATESLVNKQYLRNIKANHNIKKTDGGGAISIDGVHKGVCLQFQKSESCRREHANYAIDHQITAEAAIGIQVAYTFKALKLIISDSRIAHLAHEACQTMFEKGFQGEFVLTYKQP
jgi:hypothetical protein